MNEEDYKEDVPDCINCEYSKYSNETKEEICIIKGKCPRGYENNNM